MRDQAKEREQRDKLKAQGTLTQGTAATRTAGNRNRKRLGDSDGDQAFSEEGAP